MNREEIIKELNEAKNGEELKALIAKYSNELSDEDFYNIASNGCECESRAENLVLY